MKNPLFFGKNSFPINQTHFGVIITFPYLGMEMIPDHRRSTQHTEVGPRQTRAATAENSWVIYRLIHGGKSLGLYTLHTSHSHSGWALIGNKTQQFISEQYFEQVDEKLYTSSDRSIVERSFPLYGDEKGFTARQFGPGGWEFAKCGFFENNGQ